MISRNLSIIPGLGRTGFGRDQIYPDISILSISSVIFLWIFSDIFQPFQPSSSHSPGRVRTLEGVDFLEKGLARDPGRRQVPHGDGVHLSRAGPPSHGKAWRLRTKDPHVLRKKKVGQTRRIPQNHHVYGWYKSL